MSPLKHQVEIALQIVRVELDQPPGIDDRRPGVHPVAAIAAGDAKAFFRRQIDRLERDRIQPRPGLQQRQFQQLAGQLA